MREQQAGRNVSPGVHLTGANRSSLLEAFAAIDGPALRHLERNRGFFSALRADRSGHHTRVGMCGRSIRTRRSPLRLAVLAALRLIPEAFAGVEKLLARRENKFRPAVNTLKSLVFVFHPGSLSLSPASILKPERDVILRLESSVAAGRVYSLSIRVFFRARLRASAAFTRRLSPGFR